MFAFSHTLEIVNFFWLANIYSSDTYIQPPTFGSEIFAS